MIDKVTRPRLDGKPKPVPSLTESVLCALESRSGSLCSLVARGFKPFINMLPLLFIPLPCRIVRNSLQAIKTKEVESLLHPAFLDFCYVDSELEVVPFPRMA